MIKVEDIEAIKPKFYRSESGGNKVEIQQKTFLDELDPRGHIINNPLIYENIVKRIPRKDRNGEDMLDANGNMIFDYIEVPIERVSIPMQSVIKTKHVANITANKLKFVHLSNNPSQEEKNSFIDFKNGWVTKNLETAKFEFADSIASVGDAAFCAIINKGKFRYRVFSILNGDTLHPVFDDLGDVRVFGRGYTKYDYTKKETVSCLDIWDDTNLTTFVSSSNNDSENKFDSFFWDEKDDFKLKIDANGIDNSWEMVSSKRHGFERCPITYYQDPSGACWSNVQHLIENLEYALSQLGENNKSYAFRILAIKGGFEIQAEDEGTRKGQARAILLDENSDAKFLDKADASSSFELQLRTTLQHILLGSFTVVPPEINGDISGVAVKILYSPAYEKGTEDVNKLNKSIDDIVSLFKFGYGLELGQSAQFNKLNVRGDLTVFIPQNEYELTQILTLGVQNKFISIESAIDSCDRTSPDEVDRLTKQEKMLADMEANAARQQLVGTQEPLV